MTPETLVLCLWGSLDGQHIRWGGPHFTNETDLYRFRWWTTNGRDIPVYIKAGRIDGTPTELHPDTKTKIAGLLQTDPR